MRGLQRLAVWRRLTDSRRWMLPQAMLYLLLARLAIRLLHFRTLAWFFVRPASRPEAAGDARAQAIKDVRWAIKTASQHQPDLVFCFPRAIAAQAMLRQRGVSVTLYYGATAQSDKGLHAHVWLQDGDQGIIGRRIAQAAGHKVLACYAGPAARPAAAAAAPADSQHLQRG